MKHLDKKQLQLLKKIKRSGIYDCSSLSEEERSIIVFLRSEKLLDAKVRTGSIPTNGQLITYELELLSVTISEYGKAFLSELRTDKFRWYIPLIISIIAAIGAYRSELAVLLQAIAELLKPTLTDTGNAVSYIIDNLDKMF